jgi:phosphatidylglycerol lysyltransferase
MAAIEGHRLRHPVSAGLSALNSIAQAVGPPVIAAMVFGGGGILLFSGVTPGLGSRMDLLNGLLPLPFIETSHFAASLIGLLLLIVAPALQARLASGFQIARLLALLGALFSLLKGIDYEEAGALLLIAGFLQYCRPAFYRRAGIGTAPIGRWWWAAILIALAASSWVGLVAYRHVPYSNDLWWDFTWNGNAPRYLRALLGCLVLLAGFAIWRLLSAPAAVETQRDLPPDVAARAMQVATRTESMLAFTGDKSFIVSAAGDAFLIYGIQGRTWVIMGDPVGPVSAWPELLWEIRRRSDAVHGRLCLYQISAQMLPLLVDLGLTAIKYGEEAMVPLNHFSLDGPKAKPLRYALKKGASLGLSFDVVPAAEVPGIGPELEAISDAWLAHKKGGEKGFSVGRFSHEYMARYDCAVLRRGERIIAFANIWALPNREEMSIDLMRHYPDAPNGTMDFLIVHLIQLAAARGFKRFNLGMAPLSGLSGDRLAPRWSKLGAMIFARGERLYGFSGLRAFKAKFSPRWQPLYIGLSPSRSALRALADLVALIER